MNCIKTLFLKLVNIPVALRTRLYPSVNRAILRCKGVRFGYNLQIFNKFYLIGGGKISIGNDFMMTSDDCINPISSNLRGAFFTEDGAEITIGDRVGMSATRMWIKSKLTIGNDVKIGGNVLIIDTDCHPLDWRLRALHPNTAEERRRVDNAIASKPITIEDDVWIGANCTILKGVTIGARSVIGAGSVVTKSVPPDSVAAGNPARVIRRLEE